MEDKRFAHVFSDPKFRRIPKSERTVKIDKRFQSMFKNKQFKVKYTVDKRGRPVNYSSNEDLKRYYELSSEDSSSNESGAEDETSENCIEASEKPKVPILFDDNSSNLSENRSSDTIIPVAINKKLHNLNVDYARGESTLYSESSSDDDKSEEDESESELIDHKWGEMDADAAHTENITHRLAACNMDWDRIKALDLMVLFHSFLPLGGIIKSIRIYPSEFGKQRMKEEEIKGPIELINSKAPEDAKTEEGSKYHMEKLRQYQLNRLKYYYAVIVCDSSNTASQIYTECDGIEYESSATKIDLRFIPDELQFDDKPREACDKVPELNKYQPRFFTTTALQQAKVELTWDETNPDRVEIAQKLTGGKIDDVTDADLEAYLALSSDEESENPEKFTDACDDTDLAPIDKYKALLQDIKNQENAQKNKDVEMEVTWGIDLKEKTEKAVKQAINKNDVKTPFQQYLEKRKQKRKERKRENSKNLDSDVPSHIDMDDPYFAEEFNTPEFTSAKNNKKIKGHKSNDDETDKQTELELLLMNDDFTKKHFSLKGIQENENNSNPQKKRKRKQIKAAVASVDSFQVNVNDARFSALYTSHNYNIDPSDSHFKKTKGLDAIVTEKLKRRVESNEVEAKTSTTTRHKKNTELSVLIKSVKRNSKAFVDKSK